MSIRPFFALAGAASLAALVGVATVPAARAMPVAAPVATAVVDDTAGSAVTPGSGLVEKVWYHRGWRGRRRGYCYYHPRRCR